MSDKKVEVLGRGAITKEIKRVSKEKLGYKISQKELRFMAYLHFVMVNERKIDLQKINAEEVGFFNDWVVKKFIIFEGEEARMTKDFWLALSEIVYWGYVNCK